MPPLGQKKSKSSTAPQETAPAPAPMPPAPTTRAAAAAPAPKPAAKPAPKTTRTGEPGAPVWPGENATDEQKLQWEREFQAYAGALGGVARTAPYGTSTVTGASKPVEAAPSPTQSALSQVAEMRRQRAVQKREAELKAGEEAAEFGGYLGGAAGTVVGGGWNSKIGYDLARKAARGAPLAQQIADASKGAVTGLAGAPGQRMGALGRVGGLAGIGAALGSAARSYSIPNADEYDVPAEAMIPVVAGAAPPHSTSSVLAAPVRFVYGDQQKFYPPEGAEFHPPILGQMITQPEQMYRRKREISPDVYADPDTYETTSRLYEQAYRRSKGELKRASPEQYRDVARRVAALKSVMMGELGYTPEELSVLTPPE